MKRFCGYKDVGRKGASVPQFRRRARLISTAEHIPQSLHAMTDDCTLLADQARLFVEDDPYAANRFAQRLMVPGDQGFSAVFVRFLKFALQLLPEVASFGRSDAPSDRAM